MEGRRVLRHPTVEQNLIVGGHMEPSGRGVRQRLDGVYGRIGRLAALKYRVTGYFSGGDTDGGDRPRDDGRPKLIMIDEPSLGLAPMMVDEVFERSALFEGRRLDTADRRTEHFVSRSTSPISDTLWKTDASCWKVTRPTFAPTRTSANSISASTSKANARATATSSIIGAANDG